MAGYGVQNWLWAACPSFTLFKSFTTIYLSWYCSRCGGLNSWRVSSMLGSLSCLMQRHGFNPPQGWFFPVEGICPLGLTWVLTSLPQNSFRWEYKLRSCLCTHAFHPTHSKDPDIHVLGESRQQKHTQHAQSTKMEYDYLNGWIKKKQKTVTYTKISPKMVNPRNAEEEENPSAACFIHLDGFLVSSIDMYLLSLFFLFHSLGWASRYWFVKVQ